MRRVVLALVLLTAFAPALARADLPPQAPPPPAPAPLAPPPSMPSLEPPPIYSPPAYDPMSTSTPTPVVAPPAPPPPLGPGVVRLHLLGPSGLLLKRDSGPPVMVYDEKGSRLISGAICVAPCDAVVDARSGTSFVFGGGDGVPDSSSFDFSGRGGEVSAHVDPGSKPMRLGAAVLGGFSLATGYLGLLVLTSTSGGSTSERDAQTQGGLVVLGVAAAMAVGSGLFFLLSRTRYDLEDTSPPAGKP